MPNSGRAEIKLHLFRHGQKVFVRNLTSLLLEKEHGEGPFRVVAVDAAPTALTPDCSCKRQDGGHWPHCDSRLSSTQDVGHTQVVGLEMPDGSIQNFSGYCLEPA